MGTRGASTGAWTTRGAGASFATASGRAGGIGSTGGGDTAPAFVVVRVASSGIASTAGDVARASVAGAGVPAGSRASSAPGVPA